MVDALVLSLLLAISPHIVFKGAIFQHDLFFWSCCRCQGNTTAWMHIKSRTPTFIFIATTSTRRPIPLIFSLSAHILTDGWHILCRFRLSCGCKCSGTDHARARYERSLRVHFMRSTTHTLGSFAYVYSQGRLYQRRNLYAIWPWHLHRLRCPLRMHHNFLSPGYPTTFILRSPPFRRHDRASRRCTRQVLSDGREGDEATGELMEDPQGTTSLNHLMVSLTFIWGINSC